MNTTPDERSEKVSRTTGVPDLTLGRLQHSCERFYSPLVADTHVSFLVTVIYQALTETTSLLNLRYRARTERDVVITDSAVCELDGGIEIL